MSANYGVLCENDIIDLCQNGDKEAFNVLFSRYENEVLRTVYYYLNDYHQAFDEAQEIFIKVYKNINTFQGKSSFLSWLVKITINHCFSVIKKKKRFVISGSEDSLEKASVEYNGCVQNSSFFNEMRDRNIKHNLKNAISKLPNKQKQALVLYHYDNLNYAEIAEIMKENKSTVGICLFRARMNLKKKLLKNIQNGNEWLYWKDSYYFS